MIQSLDKDGSSATLLHLHTNQEIRAHYTNLQPFAFNPAVNRLPDSFNEEIWKLFPDKYSVLKYHPRTPIRRKLLNEQATLHRLNHQSSQLSTQNERPIADIRVQFNHRETPHIDHQTTVDRPATPFSPIRSSNHPTRERSISPYRSQSRSNSSLSPDDEPEDNLTDSSSSDGISDNESLYSKAVRTLNEELGIPNSGSEYDSEVSHPRTANRPARRSRRSTPDSDITFRLWAEEALDKRKQSDTEQESVPDLSLDRDYVVDSDNSNSSGRLKDWRSHLQPRHRAAYYYSSDSGSEDESDHQVSREHHHLEPNTQFRDTHSILDDENSDDPTPLHSLEVTEHPDLMDIDAEILSQPQNSESELGDKFHQEADEDNLIIFKDQHPILDRLVPPEGLAAPEEPSQRYNLRHRRAPNPYTASGKVSDRLF